MDNFKIVETITDNQIETKIFRKINSKLRDYLPCEKDENEKECKYLKIIHGNEYCKKHKCLLSKILTCQGFYK